eukprot:tig00001085_g6960.t1
METSSSFVAAGGVAFGAARLSRAVPAAGRTIANRIVSGARTVSAPAAVKSAALSQPLRGSFFGGVEPARRWLVPKPTAASSRRFFIVSQAPAGASTAPSPTDAPAIGTRKHGFKLERAEYIKELDTQALVWVHEKTGAELLSLINNDENKVFGAVFRTPPKDSTGVPHILEHSVLCGSRKYPTKEPFVELLKGSLQTFLNAFTFPDKTCYPVASCNTQDFRNLVDVYLDAVFFPNCVKDPLVLKQEGWHLEAESEEAPLTYKGVVFNEMKGVYSSPDSVLSSESMRRLFPDTTYGVESGGDPRSTSASNICDLTFEQFKAFHEEFYHPSNARLFFYGDFDADERLTILDEYLSQFERIAPSSEIGLQAKWSAPRRVEELYDAGDNAAAAKAFVTMQWLLPEVTDFKLGLALEILADVLLGTPASPLRKALIDSGLGEDVTSGGLESELRQMYFSTGLKGVKPEDIPRVEELILETLKSLAARGLDPADVQASLNTTEFQLRENNTGSFPRGLSLLLRSLSTWLYGGDCLAPLKYEEPLAWLKERIAGGRFFEGLIEEHLLKNPHRLAFVLKPDSTIGAKEEEAERRRLEKAKEALGAEGMRRTVQETEELRKKQDTPDTEEALASIPMLGLKDLDPKIKSIPTRKLTSSGVTVLQHDLFTNDILYLALAVIQKFRVQRTPPCPVQNLESDGHRQDLALDISRVPATDLPLLNVFSRALLQMGTSKENFVQLSQRIGQRTGGIKTSTFTSAGSMGGPPQTWLMVRGKAMRSEAGELLDVLREVLTDLRLDDPARFKQILLEQKAALEARLVPAGHTLAGQRLAACFSAADWAAEQLGGISQLAFLRALSEKVDREWGDVLAALKRVQAALVDRSSMIANVTLDDAGFAQFAPQLDAMLASLPEGAPRGAVWTPSLLAGGEGFCIPAQVGYVGKSANLYDLGYQLDGSALAISNFLSSGYLWNEVRVQGGAYGGFCRFDPRSGVFTFLSYRDPNLLRTLGAYDGAAEHLRTVDLSEQALTQAVLGTFGDLDAYQLPDAKGMTAFVRHVVGDTDEYRQRIRDQVRGASAKQFREFGDVMAEVAKQGKVVVIGNKDSIEKANTEKGAPFLKPIQL